MNVLFITADQWRGECLSALGHPCLQTPNLDALAAEGILFTRHFAQATPCGPSRASLYTGLYLHNHRQVANGTPMDARHTNIALEARKAGYDPALFGYTDIGEDPRRRQPGDPALTNYNGVLPGMTAICNMDDDQRPWLAHLRHKGYAPPASPMEVFRPAPDAPRTDTGPLRPAFYAAEDSNAAFLTDEAMRYVSVHTHRPWFVHLSYLAPHPPFIAPAPFHAMYDPADVPASRRRGTPEEEAGQHPYLRHHVFNQEGWPLTYEFEGRANHTLGEDEVRRVRAAYYGMMSHVDAEIGRLVAFLKTEGMWDDTLVVFTSDHGEHMGDHWSFAKYTYFDQTFRIPLIVRDPDPAADAGRGRRVERFTENIDIMPTVLERLGLEVPAECDGRSLMPWLRGETPETWRTETHGEYDFRDAVDAEGRSVFGLRRNECSLAVIRDERYKYVHFAAMPPLFFDLENDPDEFENRADDPAFRELVLHYAQKMLGWRMRHDEMALTHYMLTPAGPVQHPDRRKV